MLRIGYALSSEEHPPERLVELARTWRYVLVDDYGVSIEVSIDRYQEVSHVLEEARSAAELVDFVHPKRAYR